VHARDAWQRSPGANNSCTANTVGSGRYCKFVVGTHFACVYMCVCVRECVYVSVCVYVHVAVEVGKHA
jgi:hypothetical protein